MKQQAKKEFVSYKMVHSQPVSYWPNDTISSPFSKELRGLMHGLIRDCLHWGSLLVKPGNTKGGSIIVQLTSCLTGLEIAV
jgi:hypothetical protein